MIKKICTLILSFQLITLPLLASDLESGFIRAEDAIGTSAGNVFASGKKPGAVLIKVNLWGDVNRAGVHYVPFETDFVSLLSYAGGPKSSANLEEAYIKRRTKDTEEIIPVNIKDIVGVKSAHNPTIQPNDIIVIPQNQPTVSDDTLATVGLVSTVLSIILASVVLGNQLSDD